MSRLAALFLVLTACAATTPPPAAGPRANEGPTLPLETPPWEKRLSIAEGRESRTNDPNTYVIKNATLMLATGRTIPRGSIVMAHGKITAIVEGDGQTPANAVIIDGTGKFVTPGLIDTHSHLGVYPIPAANAHEDGNEMTDPVTPQAQTVDAFWPQDPSIERAVAGGVTTMQVLPGSGNLIGGRSFTVKLRPATSARAMHFEGAPDGLKMACGENPKRVYGENHKAPMTRMGNLALQRAAFLKAKKLVKQWEEYRTAPKKEHDDSAKNEGTDGADKDKSDKKKDGKPGTAPDRDPGIETLAAALMGRVLVHVHCYRADEMEAMLALSDEMGFKVRSFHHALEAYKIRGELAKRDVSVSTWADFWGAKMEMFDGIPESAALLREAGAKVAIHSDSYEGIQRLNQEAAKAMASGLRAGIKITEEDAIQWVTRFPAWTLGVDARVGTLEVGKDADVVMWSEHPFSVYASAERVFIDGAPTYTRGAKAWSDFEAGDGDFFSLARKGASGAPKATTPLVWPTPLSPTPSNVTAIVNGRILDAKGVLQEGTLLLENGLVRSTAKGAPPNGADVIDARGGIVTPGLVDPLTEVGIVEVSLEPATHNDDIKGSDPIRAAFRAGDAFNPSSVAIPIARMGGITSVAVVPNGGLVAGQSAWADLDGDRIEQMLATRALAIHVHLGAASGPGGNAAALRHLREAFEDARTFAKTRGAYERNQSRSFSTGRLDLDALSHAVDGKTPVVFHADRAADILSALALAKEFAIHPIIAGGAEAWKVRAELAATKTPTIVQPLVAGPVSFDALAARDDNAALLQAAGVPLALTTEDTAGVRRLRQAAANAVRSGLPWAAAVLAITRGPADAFGMGAHYGTLEPGKVANVVVWTGDPLAIQSQPIAVLVRGKSVPLRSRQTALFEKYR